MEELLRGKAAFRLLKAELSQASWRGFPK